MGAVNLAKRVSDEAQKASVNAIIGALVMVACLVPMATAAHASGDVTSYSFTSEPDSLGSGQSKSYAPPSATISVSGTAGDLTVAVVTADDSWRIDLGAPIGSQLHPGVYSDAQRAPFRDPGHPGIDVSRGSSGCNQDAGSFVIDAIGADRFGQIDLLDATFEQHCETASAPALRGVVKYHAPAAAPVVLTSSNPDVVTGEPVTLNVQVASPVDGNVTLYDGAAILGTAPVDAAGRASLTTASLAAGMHSLTATYGGSTSAEIMQTARDGGNSLWFASTAEDYIGGGATESYAAPDDDVTVRGDASDVTVSVTAIGHFWFVELAAPPGEVLHGGTTYTDAQRAPFRDPGHPGIDVSGDGRGCNEDAGSFRVNHLETNTDGSIAVFDADFTQFCESSTAPPLVGRVHVGGGTVAAGAPTKTTMRVPHSVKGGKTVTVRANVTNPVRRPSIKVKPSGTVTFTLDDVVLGTAPLDAKRRARLTTTLSGGVLKAAYNGDATYAPSVSRPVTVPAK